jgi:CubicO group peptidase (beta-lactamase class C family)
LKTSSRSILWWTLPLAALALAFFVVSGGQPRRQFVGLVSGADALAYLPPRREISLPPGPPQPPLTLAEAGMDPESIELAVQYAEKRRTRALVIGLNGHLVFEKYWGGTTLDSPVEASEFTPLLAALLLGNAQQNGEIRHLDMPVSNYLKEWQEDPRGTITLRELLTGRSNLAAPEGRLWPQSLAASYHVRENLGATLLQWPQAEKAGAEGSSPQIDADILALVLQRALGADYGSLLGERLWQPLGASSFTVGISGESGSGGQVRAGCCLRASVGDWLRVGTLIANRGVFEGNQLLHPSFADLLLTPTHLNSPRAVFLRLDGRFAAREVVRLEAAGKQRLWMVPTLKLVILRVGEEPAEADGWDEAMIPDSIIRATRGWRPANPVPGDKVDPNLYAPH